MVNQPPSYFCNASRVTAFASVVAVNIGLVCLPRFAAELFPQLCSADVLAVSTVSSSFAVVCLAGLPRFRLTATLCPTVFSACMLGNSTLFCFDMVVVVVVCFHDLKFCLSSQVKAAPCAWCISEMPPSKQVNGHSFTICLIVCCSPQSQSRHGRKCTLSLHLRRIE